MKTEIKPFETVKDFQKTEKRFKHDGARLKQNSKIMGQLLGATGGDVMFPDGKLTLSAKEGNGKDSVAYKGIVEGIEALIRDGKLYGMNKAEALKAFDALKSDNTKEQQAGQKVEAKPAKTPVETLDRAFVNDLI
jgi:hypothetical protein